MSPLSGARLSTILAQQNTDLSARQSCFAVDGLPVWAREAPVPFNT